MLKHLVSTEWLKEKLNNPNIRIVDCRFELSQPSAGYEAYLRDHIANAVYMDLEKDMSGQKLTHGGRHPLPQIEEFEATVASLGIDQTVTVVAYDDQGGAMASRLIWLLRFIGLENNYILNTSYTNWKNSGFPISNLIPEVKPTTYSARINEQMLCSMEEVREAIHKENVLVIDSREKLRYLGIEELIDSKAGRIPSAKQAFWKEGVDNKGVWLTADEQEARFKRIGCEKGKEMIVYCGSGVTACPNVLTLRSLGYEKVRLYIGSWSDWISYPENPVEK